MYYWINRLDLMFLSSVASCIQLSLLLQVLILCHFYFYSSYSCRMLKNIPKHFCWKRFGWTDKMAGKASNQKRSFRFLSIIVMTSLVFQLKCMFVCDSEVHGQTTKTREALSMCSSGCKWLVTPIYKPFRPFRRGTTLLRTNHLLTGMILQVVHNKTSFRNVQLYICIRKPSLKRKEIWIYGTKLDQGNCFTSWCSTHLCFKEYTCCN